MKRLIDWHLMRWKKQPGRKPLLLRGARQVGKTYAVRKLGKSFAHFVEINFEITKDVQTVFKKNLDPERILKELSLFVGKKITAGSTLLFFDEVQECPEAIQALRYLYESFPKLHVIAAGSLMDFALEKVGVPVGRVSSFHLFPLSFIEFLSAKKEPLLIKELLSHDGLTPIPDVIHNKFLDLLGEYFAIGGMPEAIVKWLSFHDPKECFQIHYDLAKAYRQDFEKYGKRHQIKYIEQLFVQIPHFVGEQFQYKNIPGGSRKRELAPCLDLLEKANVVHRVHHSSAHGMPLGAGQNLNWFKMIFLDIALCQTLLGLDLRTWFLDPNREFVNRGNIAEAFVGEELLTYASPIKIPKLFYWRKAERSSSAEVDYLVEVKNQIVPIEVKSGTRGSLKSIHFFLERHPESPYGLHFSQNNFSQMDKIFARPLYSLISLADEDQKEAAAAISN